MNQNTYNNVSLKLSPAKVWPLCLGLNMTLEFVFLSGIWSSSLWQNHPIIYMFGCHLTMIMLWYYDVCINNQHRIPLWKPSSAGLDRPHVDVTSLHNQLYTLGITSERLPPLNITGPPQHRVMCCHVNLWYIFRISLHYRYVMEFNPMPFIFCYSIWWDKKQRINTHTFINRMSRSY